MVDRPATETLDWPAARPAGRWGDAVYPPSQCAPLPVGWAAGRSVQHVYGRLSIHDTLFTYCHMLLECVLSIVAKWPIVISTNVEHVLNDTDQRCQLVCAPTGVDKVFERSNLHERLNDKGASAQAEQSLYAK